MIPGYMFLLSLLFTDFTICQLFLVHNGSFKLLLQEYQNIVDAEWSILYDKLDSIVKSGAKVVLSKLPIGDVATQYFADR